MLKSIKNIFLAMSITLLAASSANAALISHDILFDDFSTTDVVFEKIGYFVVDTEKADIGGNIFSWEEFQIDILGSSFSFFTEAESAGNFDLFDHFEASLNPNALVAGIEALSFFVTENSSSVISFQGIFGYDDYDAADPLAVNPHTLDLFGALGDPDVFRAAGNLQLGAVDVPEPSMLLLFLTGLIALRLKKRQA